MVRARKSNGTEPGADQGANVQPVRVPTNQPYGARQASEQSQATLPLPNAPRPGGGSQPSSAGAPAAGVDPMQAMLAAAQNMPPPGPPLNAPSARANEPVTAGLSSGPGPGPEVLNIPKKKSIADTFSDMGAVDGDPALLEMSDSARSMGY
jgi:hypothetical protein